MLRLRIAPMLALLVLLSVSLPAHAFFDPPSITPENPKPGDNISVSVRNGICDSFAQRTGYPRIERNGNSIRITEFGNHFEPGDDFCIYPIGTLTRKIGTFLPGDYQLTFDLVYEDPFLGTPVTMNIGIVSFTVAAPPSPATPVPATSPWILAILALAVLGLALRSLCKPRSFGLLLAMIAVSLSARAQQAQTIQVTLSNAPGAPTPAQVVAWANSSQRSAAPPLQAFKIVAPVGGDFLIPDRATGDFRSWLDQNPHSARAALERAPLLIFLIPDVSAALAALQADPYVLDASLPTPYEFSGVSLTDFEVISEEPLAGDDQYGWFDMNLDAAWRLTGGYALVGQVDMGLAVQHAALRQFNGNTYVGGNFVGAASRDVGLTGQTIYPGFDPADVDERKAMLIAAGPCTPNPNQDALLPPAILGHGTHVAGLLAANGASGLGVQGTCRQCGIAEQKTTYLECNPSTPPQVQPRLNPSAAERAKAQAIDGGVQALSLSLGVRNSNHSYNCQAYRDNPRCLTIDYAMGRDVPIVGASGNRREPLDFPASETSVISVGGFQQNLAFWDDSPGSGTNCPAQPNTAQCGSNFSKLSSAGTYLTHQELLASAKRVLSTTYPNTTWASYAECGDGYGTPMGDGIGWCTGTSMSTPQIAGVVGLLRSINPLVPQGTPAPVAGEKAGLRTMLASTASRSDSWDPKLGYGIPDVAAAARKVLGTVVGVTVRNRVTPLFRLYQATIKDFAETTSPQYALSLMINQDKNYVQPASGFGKQPVVPGYTFPWDPREPGENVDTGIYDTTAPATPRASIYVLTTEYRPRPEWPNLIPLHLMDKPKNGGTDYLLATSKVEIEAAHTVGYNLRTIQGYIYQPCTPESTCVPPGAQKLWRQYNSVNNDCAVFLDSEKSAFEAASYTGNCPTGGAKMIGYAYWAVDANNDGVIDVEADHDQDGLIDGFEYAIGTNPNAADSDGDGIPDATEFPMAGIATGDPCMGGSLGARNCGADRIFKSGFDAP